MFGDVRAEPSATGIYQHPPPMIVALGSRK
jgi:hypothetical protein